ncbi:hypothetical protein ACQJBY_005316 [Aegilops geniculata]
MPGRYIHEQCSSNLDIYYMSVMLTRLWRSRKGSCTLPCTLKQKGERNGVGSHIKCAQEECECSQFAHMGVHCSHVLKVLDFIRIKEIPKKHIVKRGTRDAKDILPRHLMHYQKDHAHKNPFSYGHFNMYMHAMEPVRLGETSVEAYDRLISLFKNCMVKMQPFVEIRNGLGLEDSISENGDVVNQIQTEGALVVAGDRE